jgi:hypothetical protein
MQFQLTLDLEDMYSESVADWMRRSKKEYCCTYVRSSYYGFGKIYGKYEIN